MGIAHVFGDNVDTDLIMPSAAHNGSSDSLAEYCMSGIDSDFSDRFQPGDVLIAGANFGCGSSRESAPKGIHQLDAEAVVAESFSRIFYRNAINIGLPVYEIEDARRKFSTGDVVTINHELGVIHNDTTGVSYESAVSSSFLQSILDAGGLIEYGNRKLSDDC